ncbi:MAG: hypothetical protein RL264_1345 [Bacteroidota bacterium]|jgi:hypothetical protein
MNKVAVFKNSTQTKKSIFLTLISIHGITENEYSRQSVQNSFTLNIYFCNNESQNQCFLVGFGSH